MGEIVRPHGIHGEVVVYVRTDEPAQRFTPGTVLLTVPGVPPAPAGAWQVPPSLTIETVRPHLGRLIIAFEGIRDRDVAEALRKVLLQVDSADVPDPDDPDEFHDHQLVGLAAVDEAGESLGEVLRVQHGPGPDLLVLRRPDGSQALVPFVRQIVPTVDLAAGRVVMTPPEGLFDL